jgi:hypothetical protein
VYASENFPTKKAFKAAVASGEPVTLYSPGLGTPKQNGTEYVEGPWSPKPHSWYATVTVQNGQVVKVK